MLAAGKLQLPSWMAGAIFDTEAGPAVSPGRLLAMRPAVVLLLWLVVVGMGRAERLDLCRRACSPLVAQCALQTGLNRGRCRRLLVRGCKRLGITRCELAGPLVCLGRIGPLLALGGTYAGGYQNDTLADGTIVLATSAIFDSAPGVPPFVVGGGADLCIGGGQVAGQFPRDSSWSSMHGDCCNVGGVEVKAAAPTIEGIRIDNVEDGIRVRPPADGFIVRRLHLSHIFDDAIDDHECLGGTVDDVLSDGSYVGISSRPNVGQDGTGKVLTISNSLFRLETTTQPAPSETPPAHGALFKWDDHAVWLVLRNNVFVVVKSNSDLGIPSSAHIVSCANNQLVWLGTGEYPGDLGQDPKTGKPCLTVTTDPSVWDAAVAAWQARHPGL